MIKKCAVFTNIANFSYSLKHLLPLSIIFWWGFLIQKRNLKLLNKPISLEMLWIDEMRENKKKTRKSFDKWFLSFFFAIGQLFIYRERSTLLLNAWLCFSPFSRNTHAYSDTVRLVVVKWWKACSNVFYYNFCSATVLHQLPHPLIGIKN